ncbi:TM2 domain-containing protein [Planosporangium sp. 12N6]|uniref:TM2 domain-containing protein n=1 Tax=Planosporangium spinosum TaxID=3402278 RepID=UPI003CEF8743
MPTSDKSKVVAGILQILLGSFGAGRFYTGHIGLAIGQIAVTWLTCGFGYLWPLIDGILILVKGGTDAQGRPLREN